MTIWTGIDNTRCTVTGREWDYTTRDYSKLITAAEFALTNSYSDEFYLPILERGKDRKLFVKALKVLMDIHKKNQKGSLEYWEKRARLLGHSVHFHKRCLSDVIYGSLWLVGGRTAINGCQRSKA